MEYVTSSVGRDIEIYLSFAALEVVMWFKASLLKGLLKVLTEMKGLGQVYM